MSGTVLAVVPARGGSKGIPRKNLALVAGEPLIVHTLREALGSRLIDELVVSSDDPEILDLAALAGARTIVRPAILALDESPTEDALIHVLDAIGEEPEYVVTLEPTSPLRTAASIDACIELARANRADTVMTVVETRAVLGRLEGGLFRPLFPSQARRRQDREPLYTESSTIYVTRASHLRATRSVIGPNLYALVVSAEEALDINTNADLLMAEALLGARSKAR